MRKICPDLTPLLSAGLPISSCTGVNARRDNMGHAFRGVASSAPFLAPLGTLSSLRRGFVMGSEAHALRGGGERRAIQGWLGPAPVQRFVPMCSVLVSI